MLFSIQKSSIQPIKAREMENLILHPKVINPANKGEIKGEYNMR